MPDEYRIKTMTDILALTAEQRRRMVPDLLAWADLVDAVRSEPDLSQVIKITPHFTWVDDDLTGVISGIQIGKSRVNFDTDEAPK